MVERSKVSSTGRGRRGRSCKPHHADTDVTGNIVVVVGVAEKSRTLHGSSASPVREQRAAWRGRRLCARRSGLFCRAISVRSVQFSGPCAVFIRAATLERNESWRRRIVPRYSLSHTHTRTLAGVEHHYRPAPIDEEYYTAKLILLTLRSWWHEEGEDEEKTQSSTTLCSNQHIWVGWIKENCTEKKRAGAQNRLKLLCFFFFFLYHEMLAIIMKRVNWILFFSFFFHLSNNWFDISEHFKGSLARRLCSKLQYKAEDLPLVECQVYARLRLPSPSIFPPLHILFLPSLPLYLFSPPNPLKF